MREDEIMALVKCPECGKEISDKADSCPNCGYLMNSRGEKKTSVNLNVKRTGGASKKNKILIIVLILSFIGGILYNILVFQPKIKEEQDLAIYNEVYSLIKSDKYAEAISEIESVDLSKENIGKIVNVIKLQLKDSLITSCADISKEKMELCENYLAIVEALDIPVDSDDYVIVDYLTHVIKVNNYKDYFDVIKYYYSSDYQIRDGILNIALSGGQLYAPNLQSAIELLNGINMSIYDNNSFGISEIIEYNEIEKDCYNRLMQYANGDNSINAESVLNDLTEETMQYTEVILEVTSVINDKINPIIDSLPQI